MSVISMLTRGLTTGPRRTSTSRMSCSQASRRAQSHLSAASLFNGRSPFRSIPGILVGVNVSNPARRTSTSTAAGKKNEASTSTSTINAYEGATKYPQSHSRYDFTVYQINARFGWGITFNQVSAMCATTRAIGAILARE